MPISVRCLPGGIAVPILLRVTKCHLQAMGTYLFVVVGCVALPVGDVVAVDRVFSWKSAIHGVSRYSRIVFLTGCTDFHCLPCCLLQVAVFYIRINCFCALARFYWIWQATAVVYRHPSVSLFLFFCQCIVLPQDGVVYFNL